MATIDFNRLDEMLEDGTFYEASKTTKTPRLILWRVNKMGFNDSIEARQLATELNIAENTCRQYLRWLASKGLVWYVNKGQGGVGTVKAINSPWSGMSDF